jgi:DNA-binding MarR family transcriptional regulator
MRAVFAIGHDETTAGEVARNAQVSPAAVTAMLDELEADGLISRERSETDRRCVLVSLTDAGHVVLDDAKQRWRARWDEALHDVPADDLAAAAGVMRAIAELLDEL